MANIVDDEQRGLGLPRFTNKIVNEAEKSFERVS
jgi:hypothetical protein